MFKLYRANDRAHATRDLPESSEIERMFSALGLDIHTQQISFTRPSPLDEFRSVCDSFLRCGVENLGTVLDCPYLVRRGVQTGTTEPLRDLYVIDMGPMRAAVSVPSSDSA